jgi:hypothetical protein
MMPLTLQQLKDKVNQHIAKAQTDKAIDAVQKWAHETGLENLKSEVAILKGQFAKLQSDDRIGKLSYQERTRVEANLTSGLMDLLKSIDDDAPQKEEKPDSGGNIIINKTISVPKDFKGGMFQNVISPMEFTEIPKMVVAKKILFFGANPFNTGKLNLEKEYAKIAKQLEDKGARDRLELRSEFCTDLESFQEKTNNFRPHIIHFAGHGSDSNGELETFGRGVKFNTDKENTGLIFHESGYGAAVLISDDTLDYNFETFIEADKIPIEVIVLNACYSVNQAIVLAKRVKYVIGVNNGIADEASINFSSGFYFGLSEGKNVESAFRYGKGRAMPKLTDRNQIVLFVDGEKSKL